MPVAAAAATGARTPHGAANPEDVLLPDEGRRSSAPEFTDWATDRGPDRSWLLDPCRPTASPTDARRTGFRTVTRRGPEVDRIAVTRRGSAVFLAFHRGEYATAQLDGGTRAVRDVARAFLASVGGR